MTAHIVQFGVVPVLGELRRENGARQYNTGTPAPIEQTENRSITTKHASRDDIRRMNSVQPAF
jgi:hypothetical protein